LSLPANVPHPNADVAQLATTQEQFAAIAALREPAGKGAVRTGRPERRGLPVSGCARVRGFKNPVRLAPTEAARDDRAGLGAGFPAPPRDVLIGSHQQLGT
jgi:hypothetical protein